MSNPRLQNVLDIATWLAVAVLVAALLVVAVQYVLYLLGVKVSWVYQLFEVIAATAVGLMAGQRRAGQGRKG